MDSKYKKERVAAIRLLAAIVILMLALAVLPVHPVSAGSCISKASGDWAATETWDSGCSGINGIPTAADSVSIQTGTVVTVTSPQSVTGVTVNDGGELDVSGGALTLVSPGILSVNPGGILAIDSTGSLTASANSNMIAGTLSSAGSLNFGTGNLNSVSNTGTINVTGGTFTLGDCNTYNSLTFNISGGTVSVHYCGAPGTKMNLSGKGVLQIRSGGALTTNSSNWSATGGTVNYLGYSAVAILPYYHLEVGVSGGACKMSGTTTIKGNFAIDSGTSKFNLNGYTANAYSFSQGGIPQVKGTYTSRNDKNYLTGSGSIIVATGDPPPTPTRTPTSTKTSTKTKIPTRTPTPSKTLTPSKTPTPTITPTSTNTPTYTPTNSPTPTLTPTNTPTSTPTITPTATLTPTPVGPGMPVPYDPADLQLSTTLNMKVVTSGIHRVTYETLQSAGLDLAGIPASRITVLNGKWMVPDTVYTPDAGGNFGPGGYIEFYGQGLDTLYTDTNIYTLQVSNGTVPYIPVVNAAPGTGTASPSYTESLLVNRQKVYGDTDTNGSDPWYDTSMTAYTTPKTWSYTFQVAGLYSTTAAAELKLEVWGVTDWPQSPDHNLQVSLNGTALADVTFDGWMEQDLDITLPGGVLLAGTNTLRLTIPGDLGVDWDVIDLDKYTLLYQHTYAAVNGRLTFTSAGNLFQVTNLPGADLEVYRLDANGQAQLGQVSVQANGSTYTASFAGTGQAATYLVTTTGALYTPALVATGQPSSNLGQAAQYLIISHPSFISGLQPLVAARQAQGLTVNVVNVNDLYAKYTYGVFDPSAIQQYIAYAYQNLGTRYVLLVGGDTYDYRNYLGKNYVSYIPSLYAATDQINYIPADPLFADVNNDRVPELAIGRFPVRSTAELTMMIDKTLAYAGKSYGKTAVYAADTYYTTVSNNLAARLPSGWSVQKIYMDNLSLSDARTQLIAAMNAGTALVNYSGHGSPNQWSFSNLFTYADAQALTNVGKPFVAVQWACWTTYALDPTRNSLAQAFLFSGEQGAAALLGSVTLSDSYSEYNLGLLLTPLMAQPGMTIGQAMQTAKQQLHAAHPGMMEDVQLGWLLLGDPALVIQP